MIKEIFKLKKVQIILAPGLILVGFLALFVYQNCSKEAQFKSRAGVKTTHPPGGDHIPDIGGNSEVVIHFHERPGDSTVDDPDPVIHYEVVPQDGDTTVNVNCTLNDNPVECDDNERIVFDDLTPGPQEFVIVVIDDGGDDDDSNDRVIVTEIVEWVIYNRIVSMTKDIHVDEDVEEAVDIIINVDNSGSMQFEQTSMSNKISSLITKIQALDYHIAVTTTSPSDSQVWTDRLDYVDGKFVPFATDVYCLKKGEHSEEQVRTMIQGAVVRDLHLRDTNGNPVINQETGKSYAEGSGWERGIFTTYRAFERGVDSSSTQNANCLRTGVPKHVILISDERETLQDNEGNPLPDLFKSNGTKLRELVARLYGSSTVFKFHSIIVNPFGEEGVTCLNGHGSRPGIEYARVSTDTGGYVGSVCASDYGTQLGDIGTQVANSTLSYTLECVAVSNNGDYGNVVNTSTNQPINREYVFRGDKVEFTTAPDPGDYRVSYYCYY